MVKKKKNMATDADLILRLIVFFYLYLNLNLWRDSTMIHSAMRKKLFQNGKGKWQSIDFNKNCLFRILESGNRAGI
ncbi:MAG: hypothetical protein DWQ05_12335 [Calditrichaeota bacterium]|nr:MAG: hypothetical protein DWQ05_12335 [Calditrichota bacterium]